MAICKDCGIPFSDLGNMPICPGCIEERENRLCKAKTASEKAKCDAAYGIGVNAKTDFGKSQAKLSAFYEQKAAEALLANDQSRMRCKTCMWFVGKAVPVGVKSIGRCRRHAPSMNGYPVVYENDWCGDHKVDETNV